MGRVKFLCVFAVVLMTVACSEPLYLTGENAAEQILMITEDPQPYLGREIVFAGYYVFEDFTERYHYVLLNPSGESTLGFEIRWDGDYPQRGDAVRVRGTLTEITEFGQKYIYLAVSEITVLQKIR